MALGKVSGIDWANLASVAGVAKANIAKVAGVEVPAAASFLLDLYPGAGAAYSVCRKLRNAYSGSAIRIRRASDSTETDVGFDGSGNLNTATITSFCSGTTGTVVTVYDQSGNGYDLTAQSTTACEIYRSGALVTLNGLPAFEKISDAASTSLRNTSFEISDIVGSSQLYCYQVCASALTSSESLIFSTTDDNFYFDNLSGLYLDGYSKYILIDTLPSDNTQAIIEAVLQNSSTGNIYVDGTDETYFTSLGAFAPTGTTTFRIEDFALGYFQEAVFWPSDQSSNRAGIYSNVSTYY